MMDSTAYSRPDCIDLYELLVLSVSFMQCWVFNISVNESMFCHGASSLIWGNSAAFHLETVSLVVQFVNLSLNHYKIRCSQY